VSSAAQRPLIGVSTYRQVTSWWSWERDAALVPGPYLDVVEASGGQPLLIPPSGDGATVRGAEGTGEGRAADFDGLVAALDGLILIGGGDLGADRYGQAADLRNGGINDQRDEMEIGLLAAALRRDLPVLAICRGVQVLNVSLGGGLVQQLHDVLASKAHQPRPGGFGRTTVLTEKGSTVRHVLGERADVLCSHHQAIATLDVIWWSPPEARMGSSKLSNCPVTPSWSECSGIPRRPAMPGCSRR
jgi:putative glutamine amidotransferase